MPISEIEPRSKARKGPQCDVCRALDELPESESEALLALLKDPGWQYTLLSDALREQGVDLPHFSLSRHARGQCAARTKLR